METKRLSSHIETQSSGDRLVLLGASNLTRAFSKLVDVARATFHPPLEIFCAKGFGRSYGQSSRFLTKNFSGILQFPLWDELRVAEPRTTFAILADVGNDLAYEAPVETIVNWVEETLDRLSEHEAKCVINNVPIESLRRVGRLRYGLVKSVLFPSCRLDRSEMQRRAEQLWERLQALAETRKTPIFTGENDWYGVDPIHPRRRFRIASFERMFAELNSALQDADSSDETVDGRRAGRSEIEKEQPFHRANRVSRQGRAQQLADVAVHLY
jgi:hypothetical protein